MSKVLRLLVCYTLMLFVSVNANPTNYKGKVATEFIILHNNDMHARFEQTNVKSLKCSQEDADANKCYGGFARVAHEVRKYREEARNGGLPVFYLNAGDTYTGTPWFTIFKDNITAAFLNKLQPDAISLGNHEFDENVQGLVPFLNKVNFPVLACNLDLTKTPEIKETKHFAKSTILQTENGVKIGIIGYITPDTKFLTPQNDVEFIPEIEAINHEAAKMKASGIKIIIALGHSGYKKDQEIAAKCPHVDIVIGGHTNTFLYNGQKPSVEHIDGPYPTIVVQQSSKKVPVVQAYAYTKYLGKLHVQFDIDGNLLDFDGTPILLNGSVPRDDDVLELLELYRPNITDLEKSIVGRTKVYLEGDSKICRRRECNLGNLIADSMIHARALEYDDGPFWTDTAIAFMIGGGIRSAIEKRSDGSITKNDVFTVLPFNNDLVIDTFSGKTIRDALQHSANIRNRDSNGGFLQMSGVRVTYDYSRSPGDYVTSVEVRCAQCLVPVYEQLDDSKMYNALMPLFLLKAGDGHTFGTKDSIPRITLKKSDREALTDFLTQREVVYPDIEGRINIIGDHSSDSSTAIYASSLFVLILACFASLV